MHPRNRRQPVLLALAAVLVAGALGPLAAARAGTAGAPQGPGLSTRAVPAAGSWLRGTVERLAVDGPGLPAGAVAGTAAGAPAAGHHDAAVLAFVRTARGRVQVRAADLAGVATGSTVDVRFGAATSRAGRTPSALAAGGARLTDVRVVRPGPSRPAARPTSTGSGAAAPHQVTLALVVPPGGSRDGVTPAGLTRVVEGAVSEYWESASGGRVSFTVTNTPAWTTATTSCTDPFALWAEVARRTGFVEGPGRHLVVYVTSRGTDGCWFALGTVGEGPGSGGSVLARSAGTSVLAHELGHNLGLGHSNALHCRGASDGRWDGTRWSPGCERAEYGDLYDVMGVSWDELGTLGTGHAYRLGFLGRDAVRSIATPETVTLAPVSAAQGVRSLRVEDPGGGVYVVEYRAATGRDTWLAANWPGLRSGVVVRRDDPAGDGTETLLLDGSPLTTPGWRTDLDAPLAVGDTLRTASGRVEIRVDALVDGTAVVSVAVDGTWPQDPFGRDGGRLGDPSGGVDPNPSATSSQGSGRVGRPPTGTPTGSSTNGPTDGPTDDPTDAPTDDPTDPPSGDPTGGPPDEPTDAPTDEPSDDPADPADPPTGDPTDDPTDAAPAGS